MTVTQIVSDYLKQNGYDGLHSHPINNYYGGCGCSIKEYCADGCPKEELNPYCEPAYKHTKKECKKCILYKDCEAFENGEKLMYCGKKKA